MNSEQEKRSNQREMIYKQLNRELKGTVITYERFDQRKYSRRSSTCTFVYDARGTHADSHAKYSIKTLAAIEADGNLILEGSRVSRDQGERVKSWN